MKRFIWLFVTIFILFNLSVQAEAIKFGGLVQTWFSYADGDGGDDSGYGWTMRRIRFKPTGSLG